MMRIRIAAPIMRNSRCTVAAEWMERCWTRTNAMPLFGGMFAKKLLKASSPPAEARDLRATEA
jgi:hypothetical protein